MALSRVESDVGVVARLVDPMKMILLRARRLSSGLPAAAEREEQMLQSTAWNQHADATERRVGTESQRIALIKSSCLAQYQKRIACLIQSLELGELTR